MNIRTPKRNLWLSQHCTAICLASLLLVVSVACVPVSSPLPAQPTPSVIEPQPTPPTSAPTATNEPSLPAGWATYTSQRCEVDLSYPAEMQVNNGGAYSRTLGFIPDNPDQVLPNFLYVSVIIEEFQNPEGEIIYNYDPAVTEILLNLPVGESSSVHPVPDLAEWYTYQRLPDTTISGFTAQTYENLRPWEFPEGTKEIRYYLLQDGCTYLIGGYLDTTGSNQPGAITEDLFHQIVATVHLMP